MKEAELLVPRAVVMATDCEKQTDLQFRLQVGYFIFIQLLMQFPMHLLMQFSIIVSAHPSSCSRFESTTPRSCKKVRFIVLPILLISYTSDILNWLALDPILLTSALYLISSFILKVNLLLQASEYLSAAATCSILSPAGPKRNKILVAVLKVRDSDCYPMSINYRFGHSIHLSSFLHYHCRGPYLIGGSIMISARSRTASS